MKFEINKFANVKFTVEIDDSEIQKLIEEAKKEMLETREKTLDEGEMSEDKLQKIVDWLVNDKYSYFREDFGILSSFIKDLKDGILNEINGYIEYKNGFAVNYSCGAYYDDFYESIKANHGYGDDEKYEDENEN